jgi:hypothetical protein
MNPFRLLSKGETVKGLKNRAACYKMVPGNALPNFSIPKRACAATVHPESGKPVLEQPPPAAEPTATTSPIPAPTQEMPSEPSQRRDAAATVAVAAPMEEKPSEPLQRQDAAATVAVAVPVEEKPSDSSQRLDAAATVPVAAPTEEKPSKPGIWRRLAGIGGGWIGKWRLRGKAASGTPTVQAELALEKVTVIRNDLSDDDLEVVVGKKAGRKSEKGAQRQPFGPENLVPNP